MTPSSMVLPFPYPIHRSSYHLRGAHESYRQLVLFVFGVFGDEVDTPADPVDLLGAAGRAEAGTAAEQGAPITDGAPIACLQAVHLTRRVDDRLWKVPAASAH